MTWSWVRFHGYSKRNVDQHCIYFRKGKVIHCVGFRHLPALLPDAGLPQPAVMAFQSTSSPVLAALHYWPLPLAETAGEDVTSGQAHSSWHLSLWKWSLFHSWVTLWTQVTLELVFPGGPVIKNLPATAGNPGSIFGLGRSPGEGNGNQFHYSCLEILWTEEAGGLWSTESQSVRHNWLNNNRKPWSHPN